MTVPFDNLSKERIYSCITLSVLILFIIFLVDAAAINTAAIIALLPAPLAFSKPDFFADIPVLLFVPLRDVSLANSTVQYILGRDTVGKGRQRTT